MAVVASPNGTPPPNSALVGEAEYPENEFTALVPLLEHLVSVYGALAERRASARLAANVPHFQLVAHPQPARDNTEDASQLSQDFVLKAVAGAHDRDARRRVQVSDLLHHRSSRWETHRISAYVRDQTHRVKCKFMVTLHGMLQGTGAIQYPAVVDVNGTYQEGPEGQPGYFFVHHLWIVSDARCVCARAASRARRQSSRTTTQMPCTRHLCEDVPPGRHAPSPPLPPR